MSPNSFRRDNDAVGGVLSFGVAGIIFIASLATVLTVSRTSTTGTTVADPQNGASLSVKAVDLANIVAGTSGYTVGSQGPPNATNDWVNNPDAVSRFGLLDPAVPGQFSYAKFDNLRRAPFTADSHDGYVNYPEARASLGLDTSGLGFHIRAWPDLSKVMRDLDAGKKFDAGLRISYLAHMQDFNDQIVYGNTPYTIRLCILVEDMQGHPTTLQSIDPNAVIHLGSGMTPDEAGNTGATHMPGFNVTGVEPLNTDLSQPPDGVPDAVCVSHLGLAPNSSGFTYGAATITGGSALWDPLGYNDYVSGSYSGTNFCPFSPEMYDNNPNDNANRNTNADGHIMLTSGVPVRQMVVRIQPFGGIASSCGNSDPGLSDPGLAMTPTPTCTAAVVNGLKVYTVATSVRNDGQTATQFHAVFQVQPTSGPQFQQSSNTYLVQPGATVPIKMTFPASKAAWCASGTVLTVILYDTTIRLLSVTKTLSTSVTHSSGTTPTYALYVDTAQPYYLTTQAPTLVAGAPEWSSSKKGNVTFQVWNQAMTTKIWESSAYENQQAAKSITMPNPLAAGNYTVRACSHKMGSPASNCAALNNGLPIAEAYENLTVSATTIARFTPRSANASPGYPYAASPEATSETAMLDSMFLNFCPYYYDSNVYDVSYAAANHFSPVEAPPAYTPRCVGHFVGPHVGSVYPDVGPTLNNDLPTILATEPDPAHAGELRPKYLDVLVVGSDVDHEAMSSWTAENATRNWVLAGGHLIVFGSTAQDVTWLDPIFQSGIASSNGGLYTPDLDHPLLHTPYSINYVAYAKPPNAWDLDPTAQAHFTNVVVDANGNEVLTLSDPAAFGDGRVVLTGWLPYNLLGQPGAAQTTEAKHFIANMVLISYQDLFLDYGPKIPAGVNVVPATRLALVNHPQLGLVPVTLLLYVFPSA